MDDPITRSMIASGVLDSLALLVFIFRLWIRVRMQRVGWEDIWATVAFVCGALGVASNWVYIVNLGAGQSSVAAMWIYMFAFTCLVWAVRISIIFSIIRIIPTKERLYIYGLLIITFFLLTCLALIADKAISCSYAYHAFQSTPSNPYFRCSLLHSLSFTQLTVALVADMVTVVFPLYVLRRVHLPSKQLRLLRLLFSSNILVPIICSFHLACQVAPSLARWSVFITNLQVAACLIVCNLLVVVTYLYRVLQRPKHSTTSDTSDKDTAVDHTDPATLQQMSLTTIELLFSTHSRECSVATAGTVL